MTARTRTPRTTKTAKLDPLTRAQFSIGTGWNWLTKAEVAELRRLWIEVGDEFMAEKLAKYGPEFGNKTWGRMMFGTPAECIAQDAAKAAKKAAKKAATHE
jgi:hypothetical protein